MKKLFNFVTFSENEKYLFLAFLNAADIKFSVSGYGFNSEGKEGYYISFDLLPDQIKKVSNFLECWEAVEKEYKKEGV